VLRNGVGVREALPTGANPKEELQR
jgi:hypothetical protein